MPVHLFKSRLRSLREQAGFTMIELLIVMAILGFLAIAVLSAINPVEQINRGRDTGRRSDAEQLLSAMDRYNAFVGYFPFQENEDASSLLPPNTIADRDWNTTDVDDTHDCPVFTRLGTEDSTVTDCEDTDELREAFLDRLDDMADGASLRVYNRGQIGDTTYVCYVPDSEAFRRDAAERCGDDEGAGLPADLVTGIDENMNLCEPGAEWVCLP